MTAAHFDLLLRDIRLPGASEAMCLATRGPRIAHIGPDAALDAHETVTGGAALLLPGLVEPHAHLDKNYSRDCLPEAGSSGRGALCDAIAAMREYKRQRSLELVLARAERGLQRAVRAGVSVMRSHIDLGSAEELPVLQGMLDLAARWADRIQLEFTVLGNLSSNEGLAICAEALQMGAVAVGGTPALCDAPQRAIDAALDLAGRYGRPLDLHIDETEDPASPCLRYLAQRCIELDWDLPVAASHCCSLGFVEAPQRADTIALLQRAGIGVITLPACNLVLMGHGVQPAPRGIPPIRELLDAGVTVAVGSDNVQDPFQPWGDYDPLASAALLAQVAQIGPRRSGELLAMVSEAPARALGLPAAGLTVGSAAHFSLLDCDDLHSALCEQPLRREVYFGGRRVLEQRLTTHWPQAHPCGQAIPQALPTTGDSR
ncbi:amidohydrolase family protein [Haliea sp. E17]|uniref:amidohydrolase family protein n=1 Tax=Haliea sp. E17 TaxID=3401576 RepID=UPI003AB0BC98